MAVNDEKNTIKGLLSGRPCDTCNTASALLYCKADAAFLCGTCDAKIHTSVRVHERIWLCEVCEQAPAVVTCKADAATLCSSCDHDIHSVNPLAHRHERIPVIPFLDSAVEAVTARSIACAAASSAFLVPDDLDSIPSLPAFVDDVIEDDADAWLIPNPNNTFLYNDSDVLNFSHGCQNVVKSLQFQQQDIKPIVDGNRTYAFTDSIVPTHSESQVTNNNKFAMDTDYSFFEKCFNIDFTQPDKLHKKNINSELFSAFNNCDYQSISSSDIGVVPDSNTNTNTNSMSSEVSYSFARSSASNGRSSNEAPVMDREARVLRYREKKKNRKFQKTIRYASRKAYAETRPRIKGRFVKRSDNSETSQFDFAADNEYGVVPVF
ncbi:unnamed protein product [Amaranthus hypochondriacus]